MIEFSGEVQHDRTYGELWIPMVRVRLENQGITLSVDMLADSGAYVTLIPFTLGLKLGFVEEDDRIHISRGAGAANVRHVARSLIMHIHRYTFPVRVAWSLDDNTPPLLGRLDVFDEFNIEFRQKERRTVFRKRRRQRASDSQ